MEQLAVLPSWLAQCLLKYNRVRTRTVYGSVGLSMLRDASVFVGPMSDSGFDEGLLANGNVGLTTVSKEKVACITFKGPREGTGLSDISYQRKQKNLVPYAPTWNTSGSTGTSLRSFTCTLVMRS